jgi:Concanavalin A-like lectin/glucanases superfamily
MVICYASFRPVCPDNIFSVTASSGGNLTTAGTLYFWAQFKNRVGYNKPTSFKSLTYNIGSRIAITFNANVIEIGEEVFELALSASNTNDPQTSIQLLSFKTRLDEGVTNVTLPATVFLDRPEHINLDILLLSTSDLPTGSDLRNGMVREVVQSGKIYEYQQSNDNWVERSSLSNYLEDPTVGLGADRPVELIPSTEILIPPDKTLNLDSTPLNLWWLNGYNEDGGAQLNAGYRAQLTFWVNGKPDLENLFVDRAKIRLLGYMRRSTGVLDTNVLGANYQFPWNLSTPIILQQPLPRGYAAVIEIILSFDNDELGIPEGSIIAASIKPIGEAGTISELWEILGDGAFASEPDKFLILPNRRLKGKGLIKGYAIKSETEQYLINPLPDTQQIAAINGARNGEITLKQLSEISPSEAIRAVVSTEPGEQTASALTLNTTVAVNGSLGISIVHPTTIRSDYPDIPIRGKNAPLNTGFYLYLQSGSNFYRSNSSYYPTPGTQNISVTSLNNFTSVSGLPDNPDPNFGLFNYGNINVVAGGGGQLAAGNYRVALAYYYPTPNYNITKISHEENSGCIRTIDYGDMRMAIYDPNGDGVVRDSDRLNGQLPSHYLDRAHHTGNQSAATIGDFNSAADARIAVAAGNSVASLVSGKIPVNQLPANTLNNSFVVNSESAMLALSAGVGDIAFRTDEGNRSYILQATPATSLVNWLPQIVTTGAADMQRAIYDTTGNNIVDNAERLNGQLPSYYLDRANHTGNQIASTIGDLSEAIDDRVAALLSAGANITIDYNDTAGTLTLSASGAGVGGTQTPEQIRDALSGLTGTNRLSASAIKDLPSVGGSGAFVVATLTDAASIAVDGALGNVFNLILGGNRAIANPTNLTDGSRILFRIKQDATGGRTATWGSNFIFSSSAPVLTATPDALDLLEFAVVGDKLLFVDADLGFGGISFTGGSSFNGSSLYDNLLAWWGLDEASGDRINLAAPALYKLTASGSVASASGAKNLAATFTRSSLPKLTTPDLPQFNTGDWSWICATISSNFGSLNDHSIFGRYDITNPANCSVGVSLRAPTSTANNNGYIVVDFGSGSSNGNFQSTAQNLTINTTYFIGLTYAAGTREFKLFINGVLDKTFTVPAPGLNVSTRPFAIGIVDSAYANQDRYAQGWIDEFSLYNKVLSAAEIAWIYNGGNIRRPWLPGELGNNLLFHVDSSIGQRDLSLAGVTPNSPNLPTFNSTGLNNKPTLQFNGTNQYLKYAISGISNSLIQVALYKINAASTTTNLDRVAELIDDTITTAYFERSQIVHYNGNVSIGTIASTTNFPYYNIPENINSFNLFVGNPGANPVIRKNGSPLGISPIAGGYPNTGSAPNSVYLGAMGTLSSPASGFLNGEIACIFYLNSATLIAEIQKLEGYLSHKFALIANLPANHPYKNQIPSI